MPPPTLTLTADLPLSTTTSIDFLLRKFFSSTTPSTHPPQPFSTHPIKPTMSNSTPLSASPPPPQPPTIPEMNSIIPDDPTTISSSLLEWSDFLDFSLDDPFATLSFGGDGDQKHEDPVMSSQSKPVPDREEEPGRVRKRDPRLVCSNFLAGRVPCACPELDEKLEQEGVIVLGGPGKKRARTVRTPAGSTARCQVTGCEADISELKGYHRRHRVCLRCANASAVVLDGQSKRYCQQCGK